MCLEKYKLLRGVTYYFHRAVSAARGVIARLCVFDCCAFVSAVCMCVAFVFAQSTCCFAGKQYISPEHKNSFAKRQYRSKFFFLLRGKNKIVYLSGLWNNSLSIPYVSTFLFVFLFAKSNIDYMSGLQSNYLYCITHSATKLQRKSKKIKQLWVSVSDTK